MLSPSFQNLSNKISEYHIVARMLNILNSIKRAHNRIWVEVLLKYNIHSYLFIYLGCNDDELPWGKENEDKSKTKYMYVCHAEMNAIMNKNSSTVESCTMYVALFPCNEVIHFGKEPSINDLTKNFRQFWPPFPFCHQFY